MALNRFCLGFYVKLGRYLIPFLNQPVLFSGSALLLCIYITTGAARLSRLPIAS